MAMNERLLQRLSAYLDGELNERDQNAVDILAQKDAEIAHELDLLVQADQAAQDAFAAMLDQPVPIALARAIEAVPEPGAAAQPGQPPARPSERAATARATVLPMTGERREPSTRAPAVDPAFDPGVDRPDAALLPDRSNRPALRRSTGGTVMRLAAGLALLAIGGGVGAYLGPAALQGVLPSAISGSTMASADWVSQVAAYHRVYAAEERHLVEVAATESAHIEGWLGSRTGVAFATPDLSALGLTYQGGRLLVANGQPVAQLMYTDAAGAVFALCFQSSGAGATEGFVTRQEAGFDAVVWRTDQAAYVVIGPAGAPTLPAMAGAAAAAV